MSKLILQKKLLKLHFHPQKVLIMKLWKGNVFRSVCQEFCPQGGAWQMVCVGGMHSGGMHGRWHVWYGVMCGRGHAWWEACMAGACMAGQHAWWGGACEAEGGMHGRVHVWWGCVCVAGDTATAADSMHPTGMHSCFIYIWKICNCQSHPYILWKSSDILWITLF